MSSKYRTITDKEKTGLSSTELKICSAQIRKNGPAASVLPPEVALPMYEMYLMGHTYMEISKQFADHTLSIIISTGAISGWYFDRLQTMGTMKDIVQAKVVKSVIEQVNLLTGLLSVCSIENGKQIKEYIDSGGLTAKPVMAVDSISEYKAVSDSLFKVVSSLQSAESKGGVLKIDKNDGAIGVKKKAPAKKEAEVLDILSILKEEEG